MKCTHCHNSVGDSHYCEVAKRTVTRRELPKEPDSGDFTTSMAVGMATNNAAIGALVGGDVAGAIIGDLLSPGGLL